jgi:hypothetical protein
MCVGAAVFSWLQSMQSLSKWIVSQVLFVSSTGKAGKLLQADCVRLMSKSALGEPGGVLAQVQPDRNQIGQRIGIFCVLLVCILRNTGCSSCPALSSG